MAYRPEDELIYRNLLGGSPAIPSVAFPEETHAYGTGDQVIQPEPISAPQEPVAAPVDSAALIQEEPVQEAQIAPGSMPQEGPLPEGIDKLSVSSGGDSARVSQSRTTPVIVTKSRGKAKAPTQRDVDAAAAGDVNAATRAAQGVADAAVEASEADRALLDQQRIAEEQKARFDQEEAALMAEADARANAEADQRIAGIQEAIEAASSMKVDPSRIWNDHGTANKTRGLVAAFVGGFLQPVLGTNTIQQIIDKNIDRDIDAQKEAIAGAQRNVTNLRGLHSLGVQQAETEAGQREQERLMRRASLVGELNAEVMKMQDPVLKAELSQSVAQINAQNQEAVRQIRKEKYAQKMDEYKFEVNAHMKRQSVAASRYATSVSRRNAVDRMNLDREKMRAGAAAAANQGVVQNPLTSKPIGTFNGKPDSAANQKFNERLATRAAMTDRIRGLVDTMKKTGAIYGGGMDKYLQSEEAQALKGEYEDLRASYIRAMSGAQASDAEVKRLAKALPAPETFLTRDPTRALKGFLDRQAEDMWIDSNVNLRDNKWDPREEWSMPDEVDPVENTPDDYLEIMRSGSPEQAVSAGAELIDSISKRKGDAEAIHWGDARIKEARDILAKQPESVRLPKSQHIKSIIPTFKEDGTYEFETISKGRDVVKELDKILERGNDAARKRAREIKQENEIRGALKNLSR
jgi:hypothetical protein